MSIVTFERLVTDYDDFDFPTFQPTKYLKLPIKDTSSEDLSPKEHSSLPAQLRVTHISTSIRYTDHANDLFKTTYHERHGVDLSTLNVRPPRALDDSTDVRASHVGESVD